MISFRKEKITKHITRIFGMGDACMYFIEGESRGLLVDTAYGLGDLKGYIDSLTGKPYEVFITHGHADHANGIGQFDRVYMNKKDIDLYHTRKDIAVRRKLLKKTVSEIETYSDAEFIPEFTGEFLDIYEGQSFDLGNCTVEVYETPGHTEGIVVLLVKEDRVILFGDACGENTFLFRPEASTVLEYKKTLEKLISLEDKYDRILRQHGSCESPKSLTKENLRTANLILEEKDDHIPFEYDGFKAFFAHEIDNSTHKRKDGLSGNIIYSADKIR